MLIACPSCATSCFVEPASLRPNGRRVRRRSVWRNEPGRAARLMTAAEALAPDALVSAQSPEVPAEVAAAAEPINDAPDAPPVGQQVVEDAPGELQPAEATAVIELDAPPIVPADLDQGRSPIDVDAEPMQPETGADHKDIAARRFGCGAEERQHAFRLSRQQIPILALIVLDSIVVGWRKDIVPLSSLTASFYAPIDTPVNLRGNACGGASTRAEQPEGAPSWSCRATSSTKPRDWSKCRD